MVAHRSSWSRSFLRARKRRGLRGLHLDRSDAAGQMSAARKRKECADAVAVYADLAAAMLGGEVLGLLSAGPGSDLSEESTTGCESAALDI